MKNKNVSKFWRWNRFVSWFMHIGRSYKYKTDDINHLNECDYCKNKFNKYLSKKYK